MLLLLIPTLAALALRSVAVPVDLPSGLAKLKNITREFLQKEFSGMNIEDRRRRLQQLGQDLKGKLHSPEELAEIKKKLADLVTSNVKSSEVDILTINSLSGVDDYLFQGDIHLTEPQLARLEFETSADSTADDRKRSKRQAENPSNRWTDSRVFYYFGNNISDRKRNSVATAIKNIEANTCIRFIESSMNENVIRVINGSGCYSQIGMVGGLQDLSLGDGCEIIGTVAHEFTHALGFYHTQSREDRNLYISIDLNNVEPGKWSNFQTETQAVNLVPYEYGSMMHYGAKAFVKQGGTYSIIPNDIRYLTTIGRTRMSFYDIQNLNILYSCGNCTTDTSAKCTNNGVPNPNDCSRCICPEGYQGALCDQSPEASQLPCGESHVASTEWKSVTFNYPGQSQVMTDFANCIHWITGPAGKQIQVRVTKNTVAGHDCLSGCTSGGIEFKVNKDPLETGVLLCCTNTNNIVLTGNQNPMPIIISHRQTAISITYEYRYSEKYVTDAPWAIPTAKPSTKYSPSHGSMLSIILYILYNFCL